MNFVCIVLEEGDEMENLIVECNHHLPAARRSHESSVSGHKIFGIIVTLKMDLLCCFKFKCSSVKAWQTCTYTSQQKKHIYLK